MRFNDLVISVPLLVRIGFMPMGSWAHELLLTFTSGLPGLTTGQIVGIHFNY